MAMGDSIEDLLAQIKSKYEDAASRPPRQTPPASPANPPSAQSQSAQSQPAQSAQSFSQASGMQQPDSIDDLLAQIEGKPAANSPSADSFPVNSPSLPAPSSSGSSNDPPSYSSQPLPTQNVGKSSTDHLLDHLKTKYQEHDRAEELKRQEQLRAEQRRQEELKRQKRAAVTKQAEEWLKKLDPRSGEAVWFEEFAAKYPSRVDAAIDYLGLAER